DKDRKALGLDFRPSLRRKGLMDEHRATQRIQRHIGWTGVTDKHPASVSQPPARVHPSTGEHPGLENLGEVLDINGRPRQKLMESKKLIPRRDDQLCLIASTLVFPDERPGVFKHLFFRICVNAKADRRAEKGDFLLLQGLLLSGGLLIGFFKEQVLRSDERR